MTERRTGRLLSRTKLRLAAGVAVVCVAAACGGSDQAGSDGTPDEINIGVGGFGSTVYLPAYVADEAGYLAEELSKVGVDDYKMTGVGGSTEAIQAVQAGEYDYVTSVTPSMLTANAQGADLQEIFTFLEVGNAVVMAKPGLYTGEPESLIGQRWGISGFGSTGHAIALQTLNYWGYDESDIEFVSTGSVSSSVAAVEQDLADVYVLGQPGAQLFVADGSLETVFDFYDPADVEEVFGGAYSSGSIIANSRILEQQPEVCQAVVKAHQRALEFIRENRDDPAAMAEVLPDDITENEHYEAVLPLVTNGLSVDGEVKESTMERVLEVAKATELVPPDAEIDVSEVTNNSCR